MTSANLQSRLSELERKHAPQGDLLIVYCKPGQDNEEARAEAIAKWTEANGREPRVRETMFVHFMPGPGGAS